MSTLETLPIKQRHLIGVGAAIAAGCQPCTQSYVAAAKTAGACERGVRFAIDQGLNGRDTATIAISDFAAETFAHPDLDADFRAERAMLGALIGVAAAVANNAASSLKTRIDAARALGANDGQLRTAVRIARTAKQGAEDAMATALNAALGDVNEPALAPCCADRSPEATKDADKKEGGGRAPEPCACGKQRNEPA